VGIYPTSPLAEKPDRLASARPPATQPHERQQHQCDLDAEATPRLLAIRPGLTHAEVVDRQTEDAAVPVDCPVTIVVDVVVAPGFLRLPERVAAAGVRQVGKRVEVVVDAVVAVEPGRYRRR